MELIPAQKRTQLTRTDITNIISYMNIANNAIIKTGTNNVNIEVRTMILDITETCNSMLQDDNFTATSVNIKDTLYETVRKCTYRLYLDCGKYYNEEAEFEYSPRLDGLLQSIVNACIEQNYFFGLENEV